MHPQVISQEQNPGDPLTACISGVRKRRIKDDSYKWVNGGAKPSWDVQPRQGEGRAHRARENGTGMDPGQAGVAGQK